MRIIGDTLESQHLSFGGTLFLRGRVVESDQHSIFDGAKLLENLSRRFLVRAFAAALRAKSLCWGKRVLLASSKTLLAERIK